MIQLCIFILNFFIEIRKLKNPSISVGSKAVYLSAKMFADDYKSNLEMSIEALFVCCLFGYSFM